MVPLNIPSDVSRTELSIIICPGAYTPMTQMLTTPGAGMAVALMVAPPVEVRVDSEVPAPNSLQSSLLLPQPAALLRFSLQVVWLACHAAQAASPGGF